MGVGFGEEMPMGPSSMFAGARAAFGTTVSGAEAVSLGASGIQSPTLQHYWASVLFTRLVVTAKSVKALTGRRI